MGQELTISIGDVFSFPVGANAFAAGQVLISDISIYVVIFEPLLSAPEKGTFTPSKAKPLLAGWTMDARLLHGCWKVEQSGQPLTPLEWPEFMVRHSGKTWVTDVSGKLLREASTDEADKLDFRWSVSPIRFEKAFRAFHDGGWTSHFDKLLIKGRSPQSQA